METEHRRFYFRQILFGIVVGLVTTLVFIFSLNFFNQQKKSPETKTQKPLNLVVTSPESNTATPEKSITVRGTTGVSSVVTVSLGTQSKVAATSGNSFSVKLDLTEGKNTITVVAYNTNTAGSQTKTVNILYLNEDLTSL